MADKPRRYKSAGEVIPHPPEYIAARTLIAIIDCMEATPGLEPYRDAIFATLARVKVAKRTRVNKVVTYAFSGHDLAESMKPKPTN